MSNTVASTSPPTFIERVHALPPELFRHIYELTMAIDANDTPVITITADYKFPVQLHIDHRSRERFAEEYYAQTIFMPLNRAAHDNLSFSQHISLPWLRALPTKHFAHIWDLRIEHDDTGIDIRGLRAMCKVAHMALWVTISVDATVGTALFEVLRINTRERDEQGRQVVVWRSYAELHDS